MSSKWEDERWCVVHWCWGHWHQAKPNPTNQPTMGLAWPTLENRASASNKCKLGLVYIIYIYIYNKLSVRTLFVWHSLFVGTKNWWIQQNNETDMPIVGSPTIKADRIWDTCCCQWGEIIQNQRTTFCVASQQSLSLSLSLSLSFASDYWSLMSDCNKLSSPSPQRLAFS